MNRPATVLELAELREELKGWMLAHFVTKVEFDQKISMLDQKFGELSNRMVSGFDFLFGAYEDLKQEQLFTHQALVRIEAKLGI